MDSNELTPEIQKSIFNLMISSDAEAYKLGIELLRTYLIPDLFITIKWIEEYMSFDAFVRDHTRTILIILNLACKSKNTMEQKIAKEKKLEYQEYINYGKIMDYELTPEMQENLVAMLKSDDLESVTLALELLLNFDKPKNFIPIEVNGMCMTLDTYIRALSRKCVNYYRSGVININYPIDNWIANNISTLYILENYGR